MPNRRVTYTFYTVVISAILALFPAPVMAGQVSLAWDLNTEPDIQGYYIYFGTQSGTYDAPGSPLFIEHPQAVTTVTGLKSGLEYFFAMTAVDESANRSLPGGEISGVISEENPPSDTTPPTVSITKPNTGTTVSGNQSVQASASDNVGVVGVQFILDSLNLGSEDTSSPFSALWNTTLYSDGLHTLTARARDATGNQTTSSPVSVTVDNSSPPPPGEGIYVMRQLSKLLSPVGAHRSIPSPSPPQPRDNILPLSSSSVRT